MKSKVIESKFLFKIRAVDFVLTVLNKGKYFSFNDLKNTITRRHFQILLKIFIDHNLIAHSHVVGCIKYYVLTEKGQLFFYDIKNIVDILENKNK